MTPATEGLTICARVQRAKASSRHRARVPDPQPIRVIFPADDPTGVRVGAALLLALERLMNDPAIRAAVLCSQASARSRPSLPSLRTADPDIATPMTHREAAS